MPVSDAQRRAQEKYDRENTVQFHLKLNVVRDAAVISKLRSQPSIQGYIKRLVEEDMRRETPE